MEHHRCFKICVKSMRSERVTGTVFFKHKCLTNPTVIPKDAVVATSQQLAQAIKGTIPQGHEKLQQVKKIADLFSEIAMEKATKAKQGQVQNNGIQRTMTPAAAPSPTVAKELSPRVEEAQPPRVEEEQRLIVVCTEEADYYIEPGNGTALISQEIEKPQETPS